MKRIYLDSNILIAHHATDKAEEAKKSLLDNALAAFDQFKDVQLCTSVWAITKMVNILVSNKKMAPRGCCRNRKPACERETSKKSENTYCRGQPSERV
jgi:hypothetical protein